MRGYFGIGAEGISKLENFGNLVRTAHGFGASFCFTVNPSRQMHKISSDTSKGMDYMPYFPWESAEDIALPRHCRLVGIELTEDAIDLPSFRHPSRAAYILGPEKGSLSNNIQQQCTHIIKIPTRFCLNVATAGAIVMYDRILTLGQFAPRPIKSGGPTEPVPFHVQGKPKMRSKRAEFYKDQF
ncbi:MAG: RNA methyltransferase [Cohaesibacteraceae bacterium]|nr:RNA methyltransferase [Cohaesibacteraceae bacterium]MBL4876236.1 RNA methyltransferase [Cohaesibacteraceae bacterium]